jgi:ribonuclease BN (tRNA processing enzyme)
LCKAANVKQLAIFHHDPDHTDDIMDQIDEEAKAVWDGAFVCREGQEVILD